MISLNISSSLLHWLHTQLFINTFLENIAGCKEQGDRHEGRRGVAGCLLRDPVRPVPGVFRISQTRLECHRKTATKDKPLVGLIFLYVMHLKGYIFRSDPGTKQILESMRSGAINIKQAAEALGMEPAMLAYQLAGRVSSKIYNKYCKWKYRLILAFSQ